MFLGPILDSFLRAPYSIVNLSHQIHPSIRGGFFSVISSASAPETQLSRIGVFSLQISDCFPAKDNILEWSLIPVMGSTEEHPPTQAGGRIASRGMAAHSVSSAT